MAPSPASISGLQPADRRARSVVAWASLLIGVFILVVKWGAFILTGSTAILADAIESGVHQLATVFMFWCFRFMQHPADDDHPYGHGRVEGLSVGFEGGLVLIAGCAIAFQAVMALLGHHQPQQLGWGLGLVALAAAVNLGLGLALVRIGKRTRSAILEADGHHVLSDVWTSAAVFVAIAIMAIIPAGPWRGWIDGAVALIAAVVLWVTAVRLMRQAFGQLVDEVDPLLLQTVIDAISEVRDPSWLDIHNLRCRASGDEVFVDLHLTVPGEWTIHQGHIASDVIEAAVLQRLGRAGTVLVHLDFPHDEAGQPITPEQHGLLPFSVESAVKIRV